MKTDFLTSVFLSFAKATYEQFIASLIKCKQKVKNKK